MIFGISLLACSGAAMTEEKSDQHAANTIFGDEYLANNIRYVREHSRQLDEVTRYQFLADWVLPSRSHSTIRMVGTFTQSIALVPQENPALGKLSSVPKRVSPPATDELFSPAIELVELAQHLGKLSELRERIMTIPDLKFEEQQRAKLAILFLIDLAFVDLTAVEQSVSSLTELMENCTNFNQHWQWPEMIVAWVGLQDPDAWSLVEDLVTRMRVRQSLDPEVDETTARFAQVASLYGRLEHLKGGGRSEDFARQAHLKNWISSRITTARTCSEGWPAGHWEVTQSHLQNLSSSQQSLLFYRFPLRGDFEITCEYSNWANESLHLMYAGEYLSIHGEEQIAKSQPQGYRIGNIRQSDHEAFVPSMGEIKGPSWFRILVRDNICTMWFNGRMLSRRRLPNDHDPWLVIRSSSSWRVSSLMRHLRIDGVPQIPSVVNLCADNSLNGWWSHFEEEIGTNSHKGQFLAGWQFTKADGHKGLFARRENTSVESNKESLIQYYRPLAEGDSLEYDFYYEPGRVLVHPALGGMAFLLRPTGVSTHHVTLGKYDQTSAGPTAVEFEQKNRRGPAQLPLKNKEWNHCKLSLGDGSVDISLNGQLVYSHLLEASEPQIFGLFRYSGQSEGRVRDLFWRHDSVKHFNEIQQQIVNQDSESLDRDFDGFEAFEHDFALSGLPLETFKIPSGRSASVIVTTEGVFHSQTSARAWTDSSIVPGFRIHGDFEVTVRFDNLKISDLSYGGSAIVLQDNDGRVMRLSRRVRNGLHRVYLNLYYPVEDDEFKVVKELLITEAMSGRFRIERRENTYYFLIADHDSPVFRLVGKETINDSSEDSVQFELQMIANAKATASTIWKGIKVYAQEISRRGYRQFNPIISNENWEIITGEKRLEELDLNSTDIEDDDLERLKHTKELRSLSLIRTMISARGVQHLAVLKKLERLYLSHTPTDDKAAMTLGSFTELRSLGLSGTQVGDATILQLSRLSKLEVLGLRSTLVTDQSVDHFSKMKSLKSLDFRGSKMSESGAEKIQIALPNCVVKY